MKFLLQKYLWGHDPEKGTGPFVQVVVTKIVDNGCGFTDADAGLGTDLQRPLGEDQTPLEVDPMGTEPIVHVPLETARQGVARR